MASLLDLAAAARALLAGRAGDPSSTACPNTDGLHRTHHAAMQTTSPPAPWATLGPLYHQQPFGAAAAPFAAAQPTQPTGNVRADAATAAAAVAPGAASAAAAAALPFQMRMPAGLLAGAVSTTPASPSDGSLTTGHSAEGAASPGAAIAGPTPAASAVSVSGGRTRETPAAPATHHAAAAPGMGAASAPHPTQQRWPASATDTAAASTQRRRTPSARAAAAAAKGGRTSRSSSPPQHAGAARLPGSLSLSGGASGAAAASLGGALGQGGLVLQAGRMGGRVGLLPGLRPRLMERFDELTAEEEEAAGGKGGKRAPREDLTAFTAAQKVARRKARARVYSQQARQRHEQAQLALADEVDVMRVFRSLVEEAPQLLLVLGAEVRCPVLYANAAAAGALAVTRPALLGSSFWHFVHPADKPRLLAQVARAILTQEGPTRRLRCRLRRGALGGGRKAPAGAGGVGANGGEYRPFALGLTHGTQGLVCTLWEGGEGEGDEEGDASDHQQQEETSLERARQRRRLEEGYFTFAP